MSTFRKTVYRKLARDFIAVRPTYAQIWNFLKYQAASRRHRLPEQVLNFTPISAIICVTKRCNLHCAFCHARADLNTPDVGEAELDGDQLRRILRHPLVKNSLRVNFTGGEPFLNKQIFELIRIAKAHHQLVMLSTNGTVIDSMVAEILKANINVLSFSLYDDNRTKLRRNIPLVAGQVFTKLHRVIFADTLPDIYDTVALAIDLKVKGILFQNYYPTDQDTRRCVFADNAEYPEIRREIAAKYQNQIDIAWFPVLHREQATIPRKCQMLWHNLKIDANGNIGPCCFTFPNKERYGNLFEDENVWNRQVFIDLRRMLRDSALPLASICRDCYLLTEDLYGI